MNTITEARVREVLGNTDDFTDEEYAALTASANADPEEGAEWLPYYKLSCAILMQAYAGAALIAQTISPRFSETRKNVEALAKLSLRPAGIGPDTTPERAKEVDDLTEKTWGTS